MSTVGTAPLLLCLVHLDVRYVESIDIQTLHLSITLSILEQIQDEFSRFSRPAPLTIRMPVLRLSSPANTTAEASEGDRLFVGQNILQIPLSFDQWQLSDSKGSPPCVLEMNPEVGAPGLAGFGGVVWLSGVLHHGWRLMR